MIPAGKAKSSAMMLQTARLMWAMFLCSAFGFAVMTYFLLKPQPHPAPAPTFGYAIAGVAAVDLVIFAFLRGNLLERSLECSERGAAEDARAIWMKAQLLGLASAESVVLFGFILHQLSARPSWLTAIFFVVGIFLMAVYRPTLPESR
jgi:hypothetical protein